jgi:TolA-binding protein
MSPNPQSRSHSYVLRLVLAAMMFLSLALASTTTLAQSVKSPLGATAPSAQSQTGVSPQSAVQQPPAPPNTDLAQMRTDLDRMESLLGNMSSEIEFLRDQNLQILLRTNAQMWRMLIRDLRQQVDREERRSHN